MTGKEVKFTNRLAQETSPYLLQHAHNPVDWYPWGEEALEKAKTEDKPILVSIGYAACHWCHVMERESFENEEVANFMNEHFINIKIDREERPDIDQIYIEAITAMTGAAGWPLNCFLTPEQKPFFGGTYFPPQSVQGRPSWMTILQSTHMAFQQKREEIETQAKQLTDHIENKSIESFKSKLAPNLNYEKAFDLSDSDFIYAALRRNFDTTDGGFGGAPKFPSTMSLHYLLRYHYFTGNKNAIDQLLLSLDRMINGGIYDQLGGGFARYTVDKIWLVPHFEKMLYDNALLVELIAEAYKFTKKPLYQEAIEETLDFIAREMTAPEGGFYASYDADSEGKEGKYYVWSQSEIKSLLKEEADLFNEFYGVSEGGNWEGENILNRSISLADFAERKSLEPAEVKTRLQKSKSILLAARTKRVKPGLDDKILLNWNALMISAYAKAYEALQKPAYKEIAEHNLHFILEKFQGEGDLTYHHTYKNGQSRYTAFLDDYAFLIRALLDVYQINFEENLLTKAADLAKYVIENFRDESDQLFFYTSKLQTDVPLRKKEFYDGATPSGNSTMAHNLHRLAIMTGKETWKNEAIKMIKTLEEIIRQHPTSLARWGSTLLDFIYPIKEVAIVGENAAELVASIQTDFLPNMLLMATQKADSSSPLLTDRWVEGKTLIYVCENYTCQKPVETVTDFYKIMKN